MNEDKFLTDNYLLLFGRLTCLSDLHMGQSDKADAIRVKMNKLWDKMDLNQKYHVGQVQRPFLQRENTWEV